jgi:hypothetical protein
MKAYGRKYDHGLIEMKFKVKLKSKKQEVLKDFSALSNPEVLKKHDEHIEENLKNKPQPESVNDHWKQLSDIMKSGQETLPAKKATAIHKWNTSRSTLDLVEERKQIEISSVMINRNSLTEKSFVLLMMITETMFQTYPKTL